MRASFVLASALVLTGCVSTSDVVPIGKDTYTVNATSHGVLGGSGDESIEAMKTANAYCEKMGKHMMARNVEKQGPGLQAGVGIAITATLEFRCLSENDPDYKRP